MEDELRIVSSWIPVVHSCFFCIPLRIGSLIIGYYGALESSVKAIFSSILLVSILQSSVSEMSVSTYVIAYMLVIVVLIAAGINKILSIVLIIGGHTNKHNLLKVYFTYGIALSVCNLVFTVLIFVVGAKLYGAISAVLVAIQLVSVFIVYCAYVHMSNEVIQREYTERSHTLSHSSGDSGVICGRPHILTNSKVHSDEIHKRLHTVTRASDWDEIGSDNTSTLELDTRNHFQNNRY